MLLPIIVLHLKEWLPVFDGKLCHHCTRPEHHVMQMNIVSKDLVEDTPILQSAIQYLMSCPHPPLHYHFFDDTSLPGPLTLSTCPRYPLSASTRLPGSRKCLKHWLKILMSLYVPAGYGPWIHTRFPAMMPTPSSYRMTDLHAFFMGCKGRGRPLLRNTEIRTIDCHCAVVEHVMWTKSTLKSI